MESPSSSSNKTVRFADDDKITSVLVFTAEEALGPLWLAPNELQDLRRKVKDDADYLKTKGYGILLKNGFDENDKLAQKHMNAFSQLPGMDYPRGSEAYLSRQHRDEVNRIHSKVIKGVLSRQRALRDKDDPSSSGVDEVTNKLRNISRKHSRSSRLFARRLGIADQRAVREGDDLWRAQAMVKELNQGNAKMARRKASTPDMGKLVVGVGGGAGAGGAKNIAGPMFGLAFVASQIAQTKAAQAQSSNKMDRVPVQVLSSAVVHTTVNGAGATCVNVIQDALDLLDFEDDDDTMKDPFTTPNFHQGVAKTA